MDPITLPVFALTVLLASILSAVLAHALGSRGASSAKVAFLEGKEKGYRDAKSEMSVRLDPFFEVDEGFFSSDYVAGYQMQLFVSGLPVGDPTRRITRAETAVNEENIKLAITSTLAVVQPMVAMLQAAQITAKTTEVARVKRS